VKLIVKSAGPAGNVNRIAQAVPSDFDLHRMQLSAQPRVPTLKRGRSMASSIEMRGGGASQTAETNLCSSLALRSLFAFADEFPPVEPDVNGHRALRY